MKIKTQLEILKEKGYTEKQIRAFYKKKDRLSKMNVRYTLEQWEKDN